MATRRVRAIEGVRMGIKTHRRSPPLLHCVERVDFVANVVTCICGFTCAAYDEKEPTESSAFSTHVRIAGGRKR
jgi:hypothetical protein